MAQYGRPDSDIVLGGFKDELFGTTNIYTSIDETSADDADYVRSPTNSTGTYEAGLSNITDPVSSSGHIIRFRYKRADVNSAITVLLFQGNTQIASTGSVTTTGTWTTTTYTLSTAEADAITDYTDLRLKIQDADANYGNFVSWMEFEVPTTPATVTVPSTPNTSAETITPAITVTAAVTVVSTSNVDAETIAPSLPFSVEVIVTSVPNTDAATIIPTIDITIPQYGRPSSDVAVGNWTTTPLWSKIDEVTADDTDYIETPVNGTTCEMALNSLTDPVLSTGHIIRYRHKKTGSNASTTTMYLFQGTTQICSQAVADTTSWVISAYTLSAAEANAITDYTNLRIRFTDSIGSLVTAFVSWAELEIPGAGVLVAVASVPNIDASAIVPTLTVIAAITVVSTPDISAEAIAPVGVGIMTGVTVAVTPNTDAVAIAPSSVGLAIIIIRSVTLSGSHIITASLSGQKDITTELSASKVITTSLNGSVS